jgi:hypothetical protein
MGVAMKSKTPTADQSTPVLELYKVLLQSEKFLAWKPEEPEKPLTLDALERSNIEQSNINITALEKHYSVSEVAEFWGVSVDLVRSLFRQEPDVLALDRTKRGKYITLRIPESVMIRVHRRLSQG